MNSQPSIGTSGFILQTQKYKPPIVGLMYVVNAGLTYREETYYALQISASDNAISSMKKLQIFGKRSKRIRICRSKHMLYEQTYIPSPKQPERSPGEKSSLECATHSCEDANRAERDPKDAEERHVPSELALVT